MWKCKHCEHGFDLGSAVAKANHTRWCSKNPNAQKYRETLRTNQKSLSQAAALKPLSLAARKRISEGNKQAWKDGRIKGLKHSESAKQKLSEAALKSEHRRLVRSCRPFTKKNGEVVLLDSSWEEALAKRLDLLDIEWERPKKPIKWFDGKKTRNYFPDFWLPTQKLFLDPKNPQAMRIQTQKVEWLKANRDDVVFLVSLQECLEYTAIA